MFGLYFQQGHSCPQKLELFIVLSELLGQLVELLSQLAGLEVERVFRPQKTVRECRAVSASKAQTEGVLRVNRQQCVLIPALALLGCEYVTTGPTPRMARWFRLAGQSSSHLSLTIGGPFLRVGATPSAFWPSSTLSFGRPPRMM
jgi:hypothetical protein